MSERTGSQDRYFNPAYAAILGNQELWNETHPGFKYGRELKALSGKVERSLKRVFAGYIDPGYPQIAINFTLGYHPKAYDNDYTYTPFYFHEHIAKADRPDYQAGMFEFNEWATVYATSYYWKTMEKGPLTTPLIRGYRSLNHSALDRGSAPHAIKIMEEVASTAHLNDDNFEHAVLNALFRHDTSALNSLISATDSLQSNSLDELAIEMVRKSRNKLANAAMGYATQAKEGDSKIKAIAKHALISATTHGWQATPGIVEVNLAMGSLGPTVGSSISTAGNIGTGLLLGSVLTAATSFPYLSTAIHESIHGYSLSKTHHGLMPISLEKA